MSVSNLFIAVIFVWTFGKSFRADRNSRLILCMLDRVLLIGYADIKWMPCRLFILIKICLSFHNISCAYILYTCKLVWRDIADSSCIYSLYIYAFHCVSTFVQIHNSVQIYIVYILKWGVFINIYYHRRLIYYGILLFDWTL